MKYILPLTLCLIACRPPPINVEVPMVLDVDEVQHNTNSVVIQAKEPAIYWEVTPLLIADLQEQLYTDIDEFKKDGHYVWRGTTADIYLFKNKMCLKCSNGINAQLNCATDGGSMRVTCAFMEFQFTCYIKESK